MGILNYILPSVFFLHQLLCTVKDALKKYRQGIVRAYLCQ